VFWFMLIALVVVVAAVALAVLGNGGTLPEAEHDRVDDPLPADRPLRPADLDALRLAVTPRGYRMSDVDDVLDRLGAELAERDARIAELEAALAGAHDAALGAPRVTAPGAAPVIGRPAFGGPQHGGGPYGGPYGPQGGYGTPPAPHQDLPPQGPSLAKEDPWTGRDTGHGTGSGWDGGRGDGQGGTGWDDGRGGTGRDTGWDDGTGTGTGDGQGGPGWDDGRGNGWDGGGHRG
jgi:DivIVA domain-containing protein